MGNSKLEWEGTEELKTWGVIDVFDAPAYPGKLWLSWSGTGPSAFLLMLQTYSCWRMHPSLFAFMQLESSLAEQSIQIKNNLSDYGLAVLQL